MSENREEVPKNAKSNVAKNPDWTGFENWLASEIISSQSKISRAKDIGIVCVTVVACVAIGGLLAVNHVKDQVIYENDSQWRETVERSNQRWIDYLSEYDFISQDGTGINSINTGEQGDLINEPKGESKKEEIES